MGNGPNRDVHEIHPEAVHKTRVTLLTLGALILFVSGVLSIFLARRISRPVGALVKSVEAITGGDYDCNIEIRSNDEIGFLGNRFSYMQKALKENVALLRDSNAELTLHNQRLQGLFIASQAINSLQDNQYPYQLYHRFGHGGDSVGGRIPDPGGRRSQAQNGGSEKPGRRQSELPPPGRPWRSGPIMGYEVSDAPNNPNFTRSYGYTIEPVSHTGLLGTYVLGESVSVSAGVANTFGPTINERAFPEKAESYKAYMGLITLTAPESWGFLAGSTLAGSVMNGFNSGANAGGGADQTSWYVGATVNTPVKGLKLGAAYDYAGISDQSLSPASYANATALYVSYQATEKLTLIGRGEYASSDALTAAGSPILGASKVFAVTGTVQYDLWKNVLSRVEFRWDHAASGDAAYGGEDAGDAPSKKNSYILLANVVYKF